jgi:hypothetical protein
MVIFEKILQHVWLVALVMDIIAKVSSVLQQNMHWL